MGVTVADTKTQNKTTKAKRTASNFYTFFTCGLQREDDHGWMGESSKRRGKYLLPPPPLLSSLSHKEKESVWLPPEGRWMICTNGMWDGDVFGVSSRTERLSSSKARGYFSSRKKTIDRRRYLNTHTLALPFSWRSYNMCTVTGRCRSRGQLNCCCLFLSLVPS